MAAGHVARICKSYIVRHGLLTVEKKDQEGGCPGGKK